MDQTLHNIIDVFQTSSFLSDYSAIIFISFLLIFGFLTYFLSIKQPQNTFEGSRNIKKRASKEKVLKNKCDNESSLKPRVTDTSNIIKLNVNEIATEVLPNENDVNELWIQVQKPKKISKNEKQPIAKHVIGDSIQAISMRNVPPSKSKPEMHYETKSKAKEIDVKVPDVHIVTTEKDKKSTANVCKEDPVEVETESEFKADVDNSESLTNSSTDDFVFVNSCKTSSDNGLDGYGMIETTSVTSGASRKKNKKQQKSVSKPLIVDAAEEISSVTNVRKSDAAKKRRPRKDN